ncbi:hypothetical protein CYMTET_11806 [Cymbomonas tetramitiformis]|uniref:Dolichyl-diphosphooligosaccharide--protein glycosyltransferase subunit 2 n=1 Tax=Cymbomonas tetramitiformis TaxID=36881 RepID=A0AAE0GLW0_9CHLO|nr:hypothetical protein CYMTET_11806 [Cymbomonas tetramitiformis]
MFYVLFVFLLGHEWTRVAGKEIATLHPRQTLQAERLTIDGEGVRYALALPSTAGAYEVKVSYPATVPCDIVLELISQDNEVLSKSFARRLLNTEKLIFHVDARGTLEGNQPWLLVRATATGIHWLGPNIQAEGLVYNIALEPLLLGIPFEAFSLAPLLLLLIMVVFSGFYHVAAHCKHSHVCITETLGTYTDPPRWKAGATSSKREN